MVQAIEEDALWIWPGLEQGASYVAVPSAGCDRPGAKGGAPEPRPCPSVGQCDRSRVAKRELRPPTVLTNHSANLSPHVRNYDWIVAPGNWMRDKIVTQCPESASKCEVIPYFVQPDYVTKTGPRDRSGICFLGVLNDDRKGLDVLLSALDLLKNAGRSIHLDVIGHGRALPHYREMVCASRLDVTFHGKLSSDENAEFLSRTLLFCMPSRAESFGIVYIEALACGAPIIGYPPVVQELNRVIGQEVGSPFDANKANSRQLADLIEEWLTVRCHDFSKRREAISEAVHRRYSLSAYRSAYRRLYERLLAIRPQQLQAGAN